MSIGSAMTTRNHRYDGHGILAGKQEIARKAKAIESVSLVVGFFGSRASRR